MNLKSRFLLVAILLLSCACEQNTVVQARYECEGGKILKTTFTNGEEVTIEVDGQTFRIARTEAASGAKYESGDISFWSKGIDALFVAQPGAAPLKCRRR